MVEEKEINDQEKEIEVEKEKENEEKEKVDAQTFREENVVISFQSVLYFIIPKASIIYNKSKMERCELRKLVIIRNQDKSSNNSKKRHTIKVNYEEKMI